MIRVIDLHKEFQLGNNKLVVLKGLNFEVSDGEMLSIVGFSGVGKSTFLHVLGTLERPTSGKILFDDVDVFSMKDNELSNFRNNNIGFVFQFHHLLPEFNALENVMIPLLIRGTSKGESKSLALDVLDRVGLSERKDHKPGELSGGEQQRVAIARAIVTKPRLVLADEPTGNLDTGTGLMVFELLRKISTENRTKFVVATHNEFLARQSHRILRLQDGIFKPEVL
jgi:lipoprotein-releasing system ATP-binding protein